MIRALYTIAGAVVGYAIGDLLTKPEKEEGETMPRRDKLRAEKPAEEPKEETGAQTPEDSEAPKTPETTGETGEQESSEGNT